MVQHGWYVCASGSRYRLWQWIWASRHSDIWVSFVCVLVVCWGHRLAFYAFVHPLAEHSGMSLQWIYHHACSFSGFERSVNNDTRINGTGTHFQWNSVTSANRSLNLFVRVNICSPSANVPSGISTKLSHSNLSVFRLSTSARYASKDMVGTEATTFGSSLLSFWAFDMIFLETHLSQDLRWPTPVRRMGKEEAGPVYEHWLHLCTPGGGLVKGEVIRVVELWGDDGRISAAHDIPEGPIGLEEPDAMLRPEVLLASIRALEPYLYFPSPNVQTVGNGSTVWWWWNTDPNFKGSFNQALPP